MRQLPAAFPLIPLSMLFLIPFMVWDHLPPMMSFYAEWWAGMLGILAILSVADGWGRWHLPKSGFAPLGLVLLIAIQVVLGRVADVPLALIAMLYLLGGVALIVTVRLVAYRLGSEMLVVTLAWTLVAGGALSALFAVQQVWSISTLLAGVVTAKGPYGASGNLGQANHLASYVGIGLVSVSYLLLKNKLRMIPALVLGGWLVFALGMSGSRSGWLYLFALAILSVGWLYVRRSPEAKRLALAALAYIAGFIFFQWLLSDTPRLVTASQRLVADGGLEIRLIYWRHAFEMFLANPLLGVGYQNFAWENFAWVAKDLEKGIVLPVSLQAANNSHNVFLHVSAEFGLPGLLLVCLLVFWMFRQAIRPWNPERWWAWAVLSVLGIHSLLEFPLWYTNFWGVFVVVLAVLEEPLRDEEGERGRGLVVLPVVLAGLVVLGSLGVKYPVLERVFSYSPERNPAYTSAHLQLDFASLQGSWFLDPWIAFAYSAPPIEVGQPELWPLQLHFNTIAVRQWPNPGLLYRQVLLQGLNGEFDSAEALLERAGTVYPETLPVFLRQIKPFLKVSPGMRHLYGHTQSMI